MIGELRLRLTSSWTKNWPEPVLLPPHSHISSFDLSIQAPFNVEWWVNQFRELYVKGKYGKVPTYKQTSESYIGRGAALRPRTIVFIMVPTTYLSLKHKTAIIISTIYQELFVKKNAFQKLHQRPELATFCTVSNGQAKGLVVVQFFKKVFF